MEPQQPNTVLCVVGPTACGKTRMGALLARQLGGEVVSVDSMQIYRGLPIGTAAPRPEEMLGVPHHMVAVADVRESWSVARFVREADRWVQDILRRGKLPVLVGGTGLYLDALVAGRDFAAGQAEGPWRARLQERLRSEGIGPLLEELRQRCLAQGCTESFYPDYDPTNCAVRIELRKGIGGFCLVYNSR